jgi:V-type H+-transporting ATPase subunit E
MTLASPTAETQSQIVQMTQFILNEAKDRAEEITSKALQEFTIEKLKVVNQTKEKIGQEYARKAKQIETQQAIARSTAINKSRLEKIRGRQSILGKISDESKDGLSKAMQTDDTQKAFITKLIVQGLLMLLEDKVQIRCRACDDSLVEACLQSAASEYSQLIQQETGTTKTVELSLDTEAKLPPAPGAEPGPSCMGGVVLACQNGKITIDNTIDSRLSLVLEQAKPTIRKLLFTN